MRKLRNPILRLASPRDAAPIAAMSRELIEAGLAWRYTPRRLAALMAERDVLVVVMDQAGDEAGGETGSGAGSLQGFAVMQFGDERAHLVLLCVHATQQRLGLGRALHDWLLKSAQVAGMASIALELRADNSTAMAFYRSLGFEGVGQEYLEDNIPHLEMIRSAR